MALSVTHRFVSVKADIPDNTVINPSNWNDTHVVTDTSGVLETQDHNFTAQSPGGSLTGGISNTITLTPVPPGINGTNTSHRVWISGGTGTAEAVTITGGTAVSGGTTGTLTFTPTNNHSGNWTITSATQGIQEALNALPSEGGEIHLSNGSNTVNAKITIVGNGNVPRIHIRGSGGTIIRGTSYPIGDLIYLDGTSATANVTIEGVEFYAAGIYGFWLNVSSGAAIHLYNSSGSNHTIKDIRVNDGFVGVHIDGTQQVTVRNLYYFQQNMSPASIPLAGVLINGKSSLNLPPTSIHITGGVVTTNGFTSANAITAGVLIQNADGVLIDSIQIGGGPAYGVLIQGLDTSLIANIYIDHVLFDSIRQYGIRAYQASGTAAFFGGITISNSHINAQNYILPANTSVDGIRFETGSNYLIFGNQIANWGANGVQLLSGGAISSVQISDNKILDNNYLNTGSISGISINTTGSSNITITNNSIGNFFSHGHQKYAIAFLGATSKAIVSNNSLSGNETDTILFTATPTEMVMGTNEGWGNIVPSVASGASIAAPMSNAFIVTGTTQITTITGGWIGREVTLIFTNATPGGVGTGGNVGKTQAAAQNQSIKLVYNGTSWY